MVCKMMIICQLSQIKQEWVTDQLTAIQTAINTILKRLTSRSEKLHRFQCRIKLYPNSRLLGLITTMVLINNATSNSNCHLQVQPRPCILNNHSSRSLNGLREILRLRNSQGVIKKSTSKQPASTSRWKRKKSAHSSLKSIRKDVDTLMCKIYLKDCTTIVKGDRSI